MAALGNMDDRLSGEECSNDKARLLKSSGAIAFVIMKNTWQACLVSGVALSRLLSIKEFCDSGWYTFFSTMAQ